MYENNKPKSISSIIVSSQHSEKASNNDVRKKIEIIENVIPHEILPVKDDILVNPTGRFVVGGPDGDAGLTGRKLL